MTATPTAIHRRRREKLLCLPQRLGPIRVESMRVYIAGRSDIAVAHDLFRHRLIDSRRNHGRRKRVAEIVEAHTRQFRVQLNVKQLLAYEGRIERPSRPVLTFRICIRMTFSQHVERSAAYHHAGKRGAHRSTSRRYLCDGWFLTRATSSPQSSTGMAAYAGRRKRTPHRFEAARPDSIWRKKPDRSPSGHAGPPRSG
jgi:hypothetical protein